MHSTWLVIPLYLSISTHSCDADVFNSRKRVCLSPVAFHKFAEPLDGSDGGIVIL